jgi:hypothetical protein
MAITVEEKFGRRLSDDSGELLYIVRGTTDPGEARTWLRAKAAASYDGMPIGKARVEEIAGVEGGAWLGRVRYTLSADRKQVGESQFRFETRGEKEKITNSKETISKHAADGGDALDFKSLINVTPEGRVEGTTILKPTYQFSETHHFDSVSDSFKATLFSLTGKVNNAAFKGGEAGEILFLGASGSKTGTDPWAITFSFAGRPNETDKSIGPITGIDAKGWEFIWVRHETQEQTSPKALVRRPKYAYVEKVYEEADFSQLGIGT